MSDSSSSSSGYHSWLPLAFATAAGLAAVATFAFWSGESSNVSINRERRNRRLINESIHRSMDESSSQSAELRPVNRSQSINRSTIRRPLNESIDRPINHSLFMSLSAHVSSASGKALLTGGYLVLDPLYSGMVLSLNAQFHSKLIPISDKASLQSINAPSESFDRSINQSIESTDEFHCVFILSAASTNRIID